MRPILVADCETDPFKYGRVPIPFLWNIFDGNTHKTFDGKNCTRNFIKYIRQKRAIVYAHNAGKFDWHFLIDYIEPFTPIMVINGRIAKFKIDYCEFRDSFNLLPFALKEYRKDKIEYWKMEKQHRQKYMPEIKSYIKSDCKYLWWLVTKFVQLFGLHLTIASTGLNQWRLIERHRTPKSTPYFYDLIKPFYYGGRVECFRKGIINHPFKVIDINSAYPYAMTFEHPISTDCEITKKLPKNPKKLTLCFIKLKAKSTGAFPFRDKTGLNFPNDNIERIFFITGWEYLAAQQLNILTDPKILEIIQFKKHANFSEFANRFYNAKLQAKRDNKQDEYLYAKYMLNSVYGKFGANPRSYHEYQNIEQKYIDAAMQDNWSFSCLFGKWAIVERPIPEYKQRFYNVAISASITGFVRAYLLYALHSVNSPLYCDTDCIACFDIADLEISERLGSWSFEADCVNGAIAGKKLYAFKMKNGKYKSATKGVQLKPADIYAIANGAIMTHKSDAPTFSIKKEPVFMSRNIKMTG